METANLPRSFSTLPCFDNYEEGICVLAGYAVGEADNEIYMCIRKVSDRLNHVLALPVDNLVRREDGHLGIPYRHSLVPISCYMSPGLVKHYKGGRYYVQSVANMLESSSNTYLLVCYILV